MLLFLPAHTVNAAFISTPTQLLRFSPHCITAKRLSRQIAANKHHCDSGSHSEVSENHWHQSSSPFPSLCQEFHSTAFLIMSMNKTPAFPESSNTAFHLLLYWHVFKVSAHYKDNTLLLPAHTIGSWIIRSATEEGKKPKLFPATKPVTHRYKK